MSLAIIFEVCIRTNFNLQVKCEPSANGKVLNFSTSTDTLIRMGTMKVKFSWRLSTTLFALSVALSGCATKNTSGNGRAADQFVNVLQVLQQEYAPDPHLAHFDITATGQGPELILTGETDSAAAKAAALQAARQTGAPVVDRIRLLPAAELGVTNWGIVTLSVANGREHPENKAELGTQMLLGEVVRVLKRQRHWLLVQTPDRYLSWVGADAIQLCTAAEARTWAQGSLLIFTNLDGVIREAPEADAPPLADIILGNRVRRVGVTGDQHKVALPDGRAGYLAQSAVTDFSTWKQTRRPTAANIERTARQFMGRPYLWGASTPRGMDCSGFTKLTFFLNGVELSRNASQQARQGTEVPLDQDLSQLRKGDLLFFSLAGAGGADARITHTGIYLGNQLFIQASGRVRISSLNPDSPIADQSRIRGLVKARRILPAN